MSAVEPSPANVEVASMGNWQTDKPTEVEQTLARGLQFTNMLGMMNNQSIKEDKALLHSLVELLISQGVIRLYQLEKRKQEISESFTENGALGPEVHLVDTPDKYEVEAGPVIDCASRYPICKGACCKLWFALSVQDLDEGIVRWNYSRPYGIAQGADGRCVHQDRETRKCNVYENRPHVCRTYDCSQDKRIWIDFEKRVINPDILQDEWPQNVAAVAVTKEVSDANPDHPR
jgi:Fe-S-cluster containining protein